MDPEQTKFEFADTKEEKETKFVTQADRKDGEIFFLRLVSTTDKETIARMNLTAAIQGRVAANKAFEDFRKFISEKYSIDFNTHEVRNTDGAIVPKNSIATLLQGLQTQEK